jgi:hypothetical protein
MDVWELIPPKREHIEKLMELARDNENCRRNISVEDWKYLEALLQAEWDEIRSPAVLERLNPVIKTILKCLIEKGSARKVLDLINLDCESLKRLVKQAGRCFRFLRPWERRSLSLNKLDRALLKALMDAFEEGCIKKVKSRVLADALAPIVEKLLKVVGKAFRGVVVALHGVEKVGEELVKAVISLRLPSAYKLAKQAAVKISQIAQSWGNRMAKMWPEDPGFIRYLLMMMSYKENFPGAI